jgi:hypothetical protein
MVSKRYFFEVLEGWRLKVTLEREVMSTKFPANVSVCDGANAAPDSFAPGMHTDVGSNPANARVAIAPILQGTFFRMRWCFKMLVARFCRSRESYRIKNERSRVSSIKGQSTSRCAKHQHPAQNQKREMPLAS